MISVRDHDTPARFHGSGYPVVLIHSLGLDLRMWASAAASLAAAGLRTICYDVRGHGGASGAEPAGSLDDHVADLTALLDALNLDRCAVVGTSMGGVIAQRFAAAQRVRVSHLGLVASPATGTETFEERARAAEDAGSPSVFADTLERWFGADRVAADGAEVRYARDCLESFGLRHWAASWRSMAGFVPPTRNELPDVPAVLVAGEEDPSTPPVLMATIRKRLAGPSELVVVPAAPHLLVLTHPDEVARSLRLGLRSGPA